MLERDIKIVRIIRKKVKCSYKYYVQISAEGAPAVKRDVDGSLVHPISDGKMGIFVDINSLTIVSADQCRTIDLSFDNVYAKEIKEISEYLNRSRRINNPENFTVNGRIKTSEDGYVWNYSHKYHKAMDRMAELKRKAAEQRRIRSFSIANEVLSIGSNICVNEYLYDYVRRVNKDDYHTKRRGAGKSIENNAPAQILQIIDNKLEASGRHKMRRVKLVADKNLTDYRKKYAKELFDLI